MQVFIEEVQDSHRHATGVGGIAFHDGTDARDERRARPALERSSRWLSDWVPQCLEAARTLHLEGVRVHSRAKTTPLWRPDLPADATRRRGPNATSAGVRVIDANGELIPELALGPERFYQPIGSC